MRPLVLAVLCAAIPVPAAAGPPEFPRLRSLFGLKKKDEPAPSKAKALLETLKSDTDEKKRKAAAEELAAADPRQNPDVMAGLIASLRQDPAVGVRAAAADSIGKLKPASAQAGVALEEAVQSDPADGVRKAAQAALFQYHLNGYKGNPSGAVQTAEPPLAKSRAKAAPPPVRPSAPVVTGGRVTPVPQTSEPPLAKPKANGPAGGPTVVPPTAPNAPVIPTVTPPPMPDPAPVLPTIPTPRG